MFSNIVDGRCAILGQVVVLFQILFRNIGDGVVDSGIATFDASSHAVTNIDVELVNTILQIGNVSLDVRNILLHILDNRAIARQEVVLAQELVQSILQVAAGVQAGGHTVAYVNVELVNTI